MLKSLGVKCHLCQQGTNKCLRKRKGEINQIWTIGTNFSFVSGYIRVFIAMVNFSVGFNFVQNKKLKQRNNFKTNIAPNEIMDLVNDSKWLLKSLSEKLIEGGKKLKGNFIMDRSGWQLRNPLINLNVIKRKTIRKYAVLIWCERKFTPHVK